MSEQEGLGPEELQWNKPREIDPAWQNDPQIMAEEMAMDEWEDSTGLLPIPIGVIEEGFGVCYEKLEGCIAPGPVPRNLLSVYELRPDGDGTYERIDRETPKTRLCSACLSTRIEQRAWVNFTRRMRLND